ncbi:MAG: hypothetical protein WC826_00160 [Microgenomates group bacterium]
MERIKDKFLRLALVGAIAGVGLALNSDRSSEVSANTSNTIESAYTLRDFEEGIRISYYRHFPGSEPSFVIELGSDEVPYYPICNTEPDEYGDNCHYLIPEARNWSKFTPITHELWDQSVRWEVQPNGSFGRAVLNQSYLPVIGKQSQ